MYPKSHRRSIFGFVLDPLRKSDFARAAGLIATGMTGSPLKTVWLDCTDCCGDDAKVFVGAGNGAPNSDRA